MNNSPEFNGPIPENLNQQSVETFSKRGKLRFCFASVMGVIAATGLAVLVSVPSAEAPKPEQYLPITVETPQVEDYQPIKLDSEILWLNNASARLGFTAEAWIRPTRADFHSYIISQMGSYENGFSISIISGKDDPRNQSEKEYRVTYEFGVTNKGNYCFYHPVTQQIVLSREEATSLQHVAGVIQPDGELNIFVNGRKNKDHRNSISGVCANQLPVHLGARQLVDATDGVFNGSIKARLSNTARYQNDFSPSIQPFSIDLSTIALGSYNKS